MTEPRAHKLSCDEYHRHRAPKCCALDCWCLAERPQHSTTDVADRERLDAIRQWAAESIATADEADILWLLDRLAALEHERDEARGLMRGWQLRAERAEPCEAALLSLQAGIREHVNRLLCSDNSTDVRRGQALQAALLPDTTGTTKS